MLFPISPDVLFCPTLTQYIDVHEEGFLDGNFMREFYTFLGLTPSRRPANCLQVTL